MGRPALQGTRSERNLEAEEETREDREDSNALTLRLLSNRQDWNLM